MVYNMVHNSNPSLKTKNSSLSVNHRTKWFTFGTPRFRSGFYCHSSVWPTKERPFLPVTTTEHRVHRVGLVNIGTSYQQFSSTTPCVLGLVVRTLWSVRVSEERVEKEYNLSYQSNTFYVLRFLVLVPKQFFNFIRYYP